MLKYQIMYIGEQHMEDVTPATLAFLVHVSNQGVHHTRHGHFVILATGSSDFAGTFHTWITPSLVKTHARSSVVHVQ